jgi:hypothetical protein
MEERKREVPVLSHRLPYCGVGVGRCGREKFMMRGSSLAGVGLRILPIVKEWESGSYHYLPARCPKKMLEIK